MPEEANRIETDRLSDVCSSPPAARPRRPRCDEGVRGIVHVTGDVLADVLLATRDRLPDEPAEGDYVLATAHRNYNTDSPERLGAVLDCLGRAPLPGDLPAAPAHPRRASRPGTSRSPPTSRCATRSPTPRCWRSSAARVAIATDSGGVQREAYLWGVPCVTMREETEWIETVSTGWNTLVGVDPESSPRRSRSRRRPSARRSSATATPPSGSPS